MFNNELQWDDVNSAFDTHTCVALIQNFKQHKQYELFMADAKPIFVEGAELAKWEFGRVEIQCTLYADFRMEKNGSTVGRRIKNFSTKCMRVFETQNLAKMFDLVIYPALKTLLQEFEIGPLGQSL